MRKLATVKKVKFISDIFRGGEKADNIVLIGFEDVAWVCIGKRSEFSVGDLCVYIEVSTVLPEHPYFDFMQSHNYKVKTAKIWGQLSQGLPLPLSVLSHFTDDEKRISELKVGDNVSDILGVVAMEDLMPAKLSGIARGDFPSNLISKTDEERIQSQPSLIEEIRGKEVISTIKMDGSSMTVLVDPNKELTVCSRNLSLKETDNNAFWRAVRKYQSLYNLIEDDKHNHLYFQGELVGEGIQHNCMGLKNGGVDFYVFNVFDTKLNRQLNYFEMKEVCDEMGLKVVPIYRHWKDFNESIESLLEMIEDEKYPGTKNVLEGIVVRPLKPLYSHELGKWLSFKVINNKYLLKKGEG